MVQAIRTYDSHIHPAKQWTSRIFYKIQNWLSPIEIPVGAADFRLISRKVRNVFQSAIREQNQFLRGLFQWVGFRQATVEFVSPPRIAGATKYRVLNLFTFSLTGITSFSKVPLRSAAVIGFIISALSVLYGLFAITVYSDRRTSASGIHFPDCDRLVYGRPPTDGAGDCRRVSGGSF